MSLLAIYKFLRSKFPNIGKGLIGEWRTERGNENKVCIGNKWLIGNEWLSVSSIIYRTKVSCLSGSIRKTGSKIIEDKDNKSNN